MQGTSYPVDTLYGEPLSVYSAAPQAAGPALRLSDPDPVDGEENLEEPLKPNGGSRFGAVNSTAVANVMGFVLVPWVVFALVMLPFALSYRHYSSSCWFVFLLALLLSSLFVFATRHVGGVKGRYWMFLGVLCFIATGCGLLLGLYDYYKYTQTYHLYTEGRWYGNVMPSDHPGAKKDAGMISFSSDAYVDPVKSVGFRSGSLYCVAPIMGDNTDNFVGFWAIGTDCCRSRGLFECGDVWNTNAHSAMVLFEESPVLPADSDIYRKAVEQAAATYEFGVPENPTFVRWVVDLEATRDQFHADAVSFLLTSIALFLVCTTVMGLGLHITSSKLMKA